MDPVVDPPPPDAGPAPLAPGWLSQLPVKAGPPWLTPGLHPLEMADWLVVDADAPAQLALKARLLAERHAEEFEGPGLGTEAASAEALALLGAWFGRPPDAALRVDGLSRLLGLGRPDRVGRRSRHPLDVAGRLVHRRTCACSSLFEGRHQLEAASLCFPSHWRLSEKLGRTVGAIHGPVPHYVAQLESQAATFPSGCVPIARCGAVNAHL